MTSTATTTFSAQSRKTKAFLSRGSKVHDNPRRICARLACPKRARASRALRRHGVLENEALLVVGPMTVAERPRIPDAVGLSSNAKVNSQLATVMRHFHLDAVSRDRRLRHGSGCATPPRSHLLYSKSRYFRLGSSSLTGRMDGRYAVTRSRKGSEKLNAKLQPSKFALAARTSFFFSSRFSLIF